VADIFNSNIIKKRNESSNSIPMNNNNDSFTNTRKLSSKNKPKLTFFDSVKVLVKDKYLMNVAMMVLSYGLTMEFTEIIWKSTVKKGFFSNFDYFDFQTQAKY
jgi:AAA family ATP:ADP antiporter